MGAACCFLRDECEDSANPNNSIYRNCVCLHCFILNFWHVYASLSHRGEEHALSSPTQGAASLSPMVSLDSSIAEVYCSPPRPLPHGADPRYSRLQQHDGLVSRWGKGSSQSHEVTDPLRTIEVDEKSGLLSSKSKSNEFAYEEESKENNSKSSLKLSTPETTGFAHIYTSEDEDVCPTCLEEYTKENPKIITKCSHHFHLGCIYEWMERSDNCPVCGKVMAFDETT